MFGFSLTKLIFTIGAVMAVWYGFKWVARMQEIRDDVAKDKLRPQGSGNNNTPDNAEPVKDIEDMVKCKVCDSFVAANSAVSCGRDNCPYIR